MSKVLLFLGYFAVLAFVVWALYSHGHWIWAIIAAIALVPYSSKESDAD